MNEDFISTLDTDDESERIKARSNVSIAKKRILATETQIGENKTKSESELCKKCFGSSK